MKKLLCKLLGHRSIQIFLHTFKWEHDNWVQTTTVYRCERCNHETHNTWQQGI